MRLLLELHHAGVFRMTTAAPRSKEEFAQLAGILHRKAERIAADVELSFADIRAGEPTFGHTIRRYEDAND
jgi:hypothetical protein